MSETTHLALPLLAAAQAQKHVTHNEALVTLDTLVQLSVLSRETAPPASPVEGDRYLIEASAIGAFAGHDNALAISDAGGWRFMPPHAGWSLWLLDEGVRLVFDGTDWVAEAPPAIDPEQVTRLGVGTVATDPNRLSVRSDAALLAFRDDGSGDMRLVMSKSATLRTASLVFQTNWSGRAEFGLPGHDDFEIKLSADGSSWTSALRAKANGNVGFGIDAPQHRLHVAGAIGFAPGAAVSPSSNGEVVFELSSNTALTIRARGADGTVRSAVITLS